MKNILKISFFALLLGAATSCYEGYTPDYDFPNMGFSLNQQTRTVVSSKNKIYVGVSIGGKREVDMKDWATFVFDQSLLNGTGREMLPESYYVLSDNTTMRPRKSNLAVADVEITFTEEFYADPLCLTKHYALPFRLVGTSIDAENEAGVKGPHGAIREGGETAIVGIKYISGYSGTYYRLGEYGEVDSDGEYVDEPVSYNKYNLIDNSTVYLETLGKNTVKVPSAANGAAGAFKLTFPDSVDKTAEIEVELVAGGANIIESSAKYIVESSYTFYSGDNKAPMIELEYVYEKGGVNYKVTEKLVLRQWPEADLRVDDTI